MALLFRAKFNNVKELRRTLPGTHDTYFLLLTMGASEKTIQSE